MSGVVPALAWFTLASLIFLPVLFGLWTLFATTAFLAEFLSEGRFSLLSAVTPPPGVRSLQTPEGRGLDADLYQPFAPWPPRNVVLVHGLSPAGKTDPRLQEGARLLARAGFRTLVPTVSGLTRLRPRPEDAETVVRAIQALSRSGRVKIMAISVGAGPALLAAADSRVAAGVSAVLSLGGYASTAELLRYFLTGTYRYGTVAGQVRLDPQAVSGFVRANADLLDDASWRLLENRDPARVEALLRELSPTLRTLLDILSPERVIGQLRGRLFLVHGKNDPAVPFTESLRLADAARARVPTRLVLLSAVGHVEPEAAPLGGWGAVGELLALWALTYAFFSA